jgi:hypothetical protein
VANIEGILLMGVKLRGYQSRLIEALASGNLPAGGVGRVAVIHDRRCGVFIGKTCNCTPEISIHTGDGEVALVDADGSVSRVKQS